MQQWHNQGVQSIHENPLIRKQLQTISAVSVLGNWEPSSKRTRGTQRNVEAHLLCLTWGHGGGRSHDQTPFNSKRGDEEWPRGCPCWALDRSLDGGCYGIKARGEQSVPVRRLTHIPPPWWPDLYVSLLCFSTCLCVFSLAQFRLTA